MSDLWSNANRFINSEKFWKAHQETNKTAQLNLTHNMEGTSALRISSMQDTHEVICFPRPPSQRGLQIKGKLKMAT